VEYIPTKLKGKKAISIYDNTAAGV